MSRRETLASIALIFVVAALVRAAMAAQIVFPRPEDTAYYVHVARNLLEGRGLVSDSLWSYQTPPLVFPRPAFEVWLPLPTFLAAATMTLFGLTFAAAQVSSVLVSSIAPVLAWRLAADVAEERALPRGRARTLALGTGLTAAVYLPLVLYGALPDSTAPFTVLTLAAVLLMTRLARSPRGARPNDPRLIALGAVLGLAALTRNEAAILALVWVGVAWFATGAGRAVRVRLIGVAAVVALAIFVPWAYRDWLVFGSPLPGQAAVNALSVVGRDIFAWNDPPTLARYLAVGPARLLEMRIEGTFHNVVNVLLLLGIPIAPIGLLALPWAGRGRTLRPLLAVALATFALDSLVFPVATTLGTFLHGAGAIHVLVILACLLALDAALARLATRLGWHRPVGWLGPAMAVFGGALFTVGLLTSFGTDARETADRFAAMNRYLTVSGATPGTDGPIITDFPIWLADTTEANALALPNEPAADVLDLARAFRGTRLVVVFDGEPDERDPGPDPLWPAAATQGPGSECFQPSPIDPAPGTLTERERELLRDVRMFWIDCP
ncbi:MAG: glycosyltransferase family 39 protein [Chloroflexota bacterium]